ncbi:unnamed protein product [Ectocarpus sp. 12 AP-2014]
MIILVLLLFRQTLVAVLATSTCGEIDPRGNYTKTHQRQGSERINPDHTVVKVPSEGSCSAAPDSAQTLPPPVPGLAGDTDVLGHAIRLHQAGDSEAAKDTYNALLEATPRHADALRLMGLTWYGDAIRIESSGDGSVASAIDIPGYFEQAQQFVWRAVLCAKPGREVYLMLGDLGEVLRGSGALQDAERVLRSALQSKSLPTHARRQATFNLAVTLIQLRGETRKPTRATERPHDRRRYDDEVEELLRGIVADGAGTVDSLTSRAAMQLGLFARTRGDSGAAVYWMEKAVRSLEFVFNVSLNPGCPSTAQELGRALLESGRANEATEVLKQALALDPATPGPLMNAALQRSESGDLVQARELYSRQVVPFSLVKAYDLTGDGGVLIRMALMMSPVATSTERLLEERASVLKEVLRLTDLQRRGLLSVASPGKELERAPFLVVYAGNNQRKTMEAIARMHAAIAPGLLAVADGLHAEEERSTASRLRSAGRPYDSENNDQRSSPGFSLNKQQQDVVRPIHVGFISKLFGEMEPHGMLLEGVILHLPRPRFRVTVCAIGGQPSSSLRAGADEVVTLSNTVAGARIALEELKLDVLIFADTTCEPVSHFLALGRVAPIQAAFWGTPITTGDPNIDYFLSADAMEFPDRTTMLPDDDPYSEQVVLFGGQGIWYPAPVLPSELAPPPRPRTTNDTASTTAVLPTPQAPIPAPTLAWSAAHDTITAKGGGSAGEMGSSWGGPASERALETYHAASTRASRERARSVLRAELKNRIGIDQNSVVYMCAQSLFKLHPDFDLAVKGVLEASGSNHLVFTAGRRQQWTSIFQARLTSTLGDDLMTRVFFVPRTVSGAAFSSLLASADVVLHPFPFGGSKTSADALAVGVPTVSVAGKYVAGRMAQSFYRTMGMQHMCCVATDVASYVQLATKLGQDFGFRKRIIDLIDQRQWVIWERRDEVFEWASFLARLGGVSPPTPQEVGLPPTPDHVRPPFPSRSEPSFAQS